MNTATLKEVGCLFCERRFATAEAAEQHTASKHPRGKPAVNRRPSLAEILPVCVECADTGKLVTGREIYPHRPDLYAKSFYRCDCGAYCGCHPGSIVPLGYPCGPATRKARSLAHAVFDPLWKQGEMSRPSAYAWLAKETGIPAENCHIGMMTADQAQKVVRVVRARSIAPIEAGTGETEGLDPEGTKAGSAPKTFISELPV